MSLLLTWDFYGIFFKVRKERFVCLFLFCFEVETEAVLHKVLYLVFFLDFECDLGYLIVIDVSLRLSRIAIITPLKERN